MSPELADFDDAVIGAVVALDEVKAGPARDSRGKPLKWRYFDHGESPVVGLDVFFDEYHEIVGRVEQWRALRVEWAFLAKDQSKAATLIVREGTEIPGFAPTANWDKRDRYQMPLDRVGGAIEAYLAAKFDAAPAPRR